MRSAPWKLLVATLPLLVQSSCAGRSGPAEAGGPIQPASRAERDVLAEAGLAEVTPDGGAPAEPEEAPLVGTYAPLATLGPRTILTIRADGSAEVLSTNDMSPTPSRMTGRVAVEGERVTFTPEGGADAVPIELPALAVRHHDGRVVLLPPGQAEAFDLFPSLRIGLVEVREGETPESLLPELPEARASADAANPDDPSGSGARLPDRLEATVALPGPASRFLQAELEAAPYNVTMEACVTAAAAARCTRRQRRMTLGPGAWAELNRAYWLAAGAPACDESAPSAPSAGRRFTIRGGAAPIEGALPPDADASRAFAGHPCRAAAALALWLADQYGEERP